MIAVDSLVRTFGRAKALDGITCSISAGESVALWGANGAGKTTLLRCVLGLIRFDGSIRVAGHDVRRQGKAARMMIGHVPQDIGFHDEQRVDAAISFISRLRGVAREPADAVLARVGLEGHARKRVRELSGGMKQRLALALALLSDPPVLLLDEVTASLDACGRREFVDLLGGLGGEGRTILFASHRVEEIAALSDRVIVLDRGRIVEECHTDAFVAQERWT